MKYKIIKNGLLRAILSKVYNKYKYISPNDKKSVLNFLRRGLELTNNESSREDLEENIKELEKVK